MLQDLAETAESLPKCGIKFIVKIGDADEAARSNARHARVSFQLKHIGVGAEKESDTETKYVSERME